MVELFPIDAQMAGELKVVVEADSEGLKGNILF
jgi:hypothetical protein